MPSSLPPFSAGWSQTRECFLAATSNFTSPKSFTLTSIVISFQRPSNLLLQVRQLASGRSCTAPAAQRTIPRQPGQRFAHGTKTRASGKGQSAAYESRQQQPPPRDGHCQQHADSHQQARNQ